MNSHALHKVGFVNSSHSLRKKRRRSCSNCRTFIRKGAIRCNYCGQRSLTLWHILLLGSTILILSFLLISVLNSIDA